MPASLRSDLFTSRRNGPFTSSESATKWNNSSATRARAALLADTPEVQEMLEMGKHRAKRCMLCDAAPHHIGLYTPSIEELVRWGVNGFVYALCSKCSESPGSKQRVLERFERLAQLQNANADRGFR